MTKILLVEDDKSLREIYGVRLLAEGYDIVSAGDGEEALAMAIKERPDLIVSDVMMPKISGFDMLDILRSTTETRDIKVIMMTALSSEDQRARGEALGADRYLVKSQVGIEDVVRTVHDVLGDAPVMAAAPNAFNAPTPSAIPRPAASIPVQPRQPAPTHTTPAEPSFTPTPQPVAQVAPQPQPVAQPQMPQPAPQFVQQQPQAPVQQQQPAETYAQPQPVAPQPAPWPQPQPQQPQPAQSYMQQQPAQILQPQPIADPQAPQPASSMPQPTAPFSTTRPANLGDRIIHPIQQERREGPDLSSLMDQELGRTDEQPAAQPQPEPIAQPQPAPQPTPSFEQPAPQPQPAAQPQSFEQPLPPVPPAPPTPDLSQLHGAQDIQFEETPRA